MYKQWLAADPQERLAITATKEGECSRYDGAKYVRVEQAAINLLLAALPDWLKTELVSNRQLDSAAIIFRVLPAFHPGGLGDRTAILDVLSRPAPGKGAYDTLIALRTWQRLKKRAEELNAIIPNPSVLVVALAKLCKAAIAADTNITFRITAFRHEQKVDTVPTYAKVDSFARVLLGELEGAVGAESQLSKRDRIL